MQRFRWTIAAIAITVAAGASPLLAQDISIGGKLGATFATIGGDDVEDVGNRTGLSIGAFATVGISPMLSLQPELLFVQKGTSMDLGGAEGDAKFEYLEIPVLARVSFPTPGALRPYIFAGPSASINLGCSVGADTGGVSGEVDCDSDLLQGVFPDIKSFDFGLIGGLGTGMALGAGQAVLDVRYNLGLSGVFDAAGTSSVKNRAFTVMIGYSIGLGG